jgi:hypothetical protein
VSRILIQTVKDNAKGDTVPKWRIVEDDGGNKWLERFDGYDAMGDENWGQMKVSDADTVGRWMRDWIFEHLSKNCDVMKENR